MTSDSSLTTDTKLRYWGLLPLKEKLTLNKAVLVFKAYTNLVPPYLKQLFICSNTHATSRFITLPKPRIDLFRTSFSFSGASLWNTIPTQIKSRNPLTSFKTQPHKWFRSRLLLKKYIYISFNIFLVSQCHYDLIYCCFVLFIMIVGSH